MEKEEKGETWEEEKKSEERGRGNEIERSSLLCIKEKRWETTMRMKCQLTAKNTVNNCNTENRRHCVQDTHKEGYKANKWSGPE